MLSASTGGTRFGRALFSHTRVAAPGSTSATPSPLLPRLLNLTSPKSSDGSPTRESTTLRMTGDNRELATPARVILVSDGGEPFAPTIDLVSIAFDIVAVI